MGRGSPIGRVLPSNCIESSLIDSGGAAFVADGCPRSRFWDLGKHELKARSHAVIVLPRTSAVARRVALLCAPLHSQPGHITQLDDPGDGVGGNDKLVIENCSCIHGCFLSVQFVTPSKGCLPGQPWLPGRHISGAGVQRRSAARGSARPRPARPAHSSQRRPAWSGP
jgi:hypothetical protein